MFLLLSSFSDAQVLISSEQLYAGMRAGEYDAVVDVRTQAEWDDGHIENATLVENLASDGDGILLIGCESCTLAVYCRVGNRAGVAITRLLNEYGFNGTLYNARGTDQWTDAGYDLVSGPTKVAECSNSKVSPSASCSCRSQACTDETTSSDNDQEVGDTSSDSSNLRQQHCASSLLKILTPTLLIVAVLTR
eukprot:CAMPEP_0116997342 /NCGR_PEP_ID=MMETSP0472-20121206/811_1 /TAXON_ID=693140 ORGANISM="Tiarina fusus, Strain LIS" /NCGR_SAMPLE_ID=MMETSP0472 /ASSEMBLY_ACC=CAM_ASM_000603 /LENGTH=191 /DNA_ID=CAMNT_0004696193 /DNA_START=227 /DNA_END=802 /DNA_ORIENTATION=+